MSTAKNLIRSNFYKNFIFEIRLFNFKPVKANHMSVVRSGKIKKAILAPLPCAPYFD